MTDDKTTRIQSPCPTETGSKAGQTRKAKGPGCVTYIYRVKDWPKHFENHRTRDMEYVRWLMVPNKQHGMGFTRIMAQIDGRSIFGVWYLIIEACSQQKAPRMGWLTDDGRADGRPWTIEDMAERWRTTTDEIARALDVLCAERVGWIETVENSEQSRSDDESVENSDSEKSLDVNGVYGVDLEQSAGETRGKRGVNAKERSGVERSGAEGGAGEPGAGRPCAGGDWQPYFGPVQEADFDVLLQEPP